MARSILIGLSAAIVLLVAGCSAAHNLERPRPIKFRCTTPPKQFIASAADVFERNGYTVTVKDPEAGRLEARDSVERVKHPYAALIRHWSVDHVGDSVVIHVQSINTRLDDSEVTQTWDKRRGDEIVKDWMRPILTTLESNCGLGTPVLPSKK